MQLPATRTNAGVQKSKKRNRSKKSKSQKIRQEKGLARAEVVMEQLEKKVDGVKKRMRKRNARKGTWDEVNGTVTGTGREERRKAVQGEAGMEVDDDSKWEDEAADQTRLASNGEKKIVDGVILPAAAATTTFEVVDRGASVNDTDDEVDKIT